MNNRASTVFFLMGFVLLASITAVMFWIDGPRQVSAFMCGMAGLFFGLAAMHVDENDKK